MMMIMLFTRSFLELLNGRGCKIFRNFKTVIIKFKDNKMEKIKLNDILKLENYSSLRVSVFHGTLRARVYANQSSK
jgi:hypothetical protein